MTEEGKKVASLIKGFLMILALILVIAALLWFGMTTIVNTGYDSVLTCDVNEEQCHFIQSRLLGSKKVDFPLSELKGAYRTPDYKVMLQTQREYEFFQYWGVASTDGVGVSDGRDVFNQATVDQINQFVKNPQTNLTIRLSNRLYIYLVALIPIIFGSIPIVIALGLAIPIMEPHLKTVVGTEMALLLSVAGLVCFINLNNSLDLHCITQECQLLTSRIGSDVEVSLAVNEIQEAKVKEVHHKVKRKTHHHSKRTKHHHHHHRDEADYSVSYKDEIEYVVVLKTSKGDFSLLDSYTFDKVSPLAVEINRFIQSPNENVVNFHNDNRLAAKVALGFLLFAGLAGFFVISQAKE